MWNEKEMHRIDWILGELCGIDFDFIQDLYFGFFKVIFQNICILNICYLIGVKRNDNKQLLFTTPNLINVDNDHAVHINLI